MIVPCGVVLARAGRAQTYPRAEQSGRSRAQPRVMLQKAAIGSLFFPSCFSLVSFFRAAQGSSASYEKLCVAFGKILERSSGDDLHCWFSALARVANTLPLQKGMPELLDLVLSFRWVNVASKHADVLAAYSDALVQAVAGSKGIVGRVFRTLTQQIRCKKTAVGEPELHTTKDTVLALHSCLRRLLQMMPAAGAALFQAVEQSYPSKYDDRLDQVIYLEAALLVSSYCPESARGVIDLVIRHLLLLDADIEMNAAVGDVELTFSLEGEGGNEDSFVKERVKEEQIKADTMDALMEKMFHFVDSQQLEAVTAATSLSAFPPEFAKQADFFRSLLHVFNARVLTSPKAQCVQYIMFYACCKNPNVYAPIFLSFLMSVFKDYSLDHQIRAAAAAYMASFNARFVRLHPETVSASLAIVAAWTSEYVDRHSSSAVHMQPDLKTHYLFYVVCNCIFYVLCFRPACAPANLRQTLNKVLGCGLNPLLFVLAGVREELFSIEGIESVLDMDAVRQKTADNRRLLVASNIEFSMDFPFDPYLLPRGGARLTEFYQNWKGEEDQDDDDDDDDDDDEEDDDANDGSEDNSEQCVAMSLGTPVINAPHLTGGSLSELQRSEHAFQSYSSGNSSSFIC